MNVQLYLILSAELCFVLKVIHLNASILRSVAFRTRVGRVTVGWQNSTLHMLPYEVKTLIYNLFSLLSTWIFSSWLWIFYRFWFEHCLVHINCIIIILVHHCIVVNRISEVGMLRYNICPSSLLWMWLTSLTLDSLVQKCWRSHWGECWGSSLWGTPPRCCGRWSRGWEWWWIVSPSSSSSNSWVRRTLCQREGKLWYAGLYQQWGHHSLWHWNVVFINCEWMLLVKVVFI